MLYEEKKIFHNKGVWVDDGKMGIKIGMLNILELYEWLSFQRTLHHYRDNYVSIPINLSRLYDLIYQVKLI